MRLAHRSRLLPASARRRSRTLERGAVLVEFALVAMMMVTMLAGAFDLGMAWRAGLGVTEAARAGARVGSSMGNDINADKSLVTSAQAALASSGLLPNVTRFVIYRADTADGKIPSTCKVASTSTLCNVFTGTQFRGIGSSPAMDAQGCLTSSQSQNWCPTSRNRVQLTAQYIGVWVQIQYNYDFRLLGTSRKIERSTVMRLEPA